MPALSRMSGRGPCSDPPGLWDAWNLKSTDGFAGAQSTGYTDKGVAGVFWSSLCRIRNQWHAMVVDRNGDFVARRRQRVYTSQASVD